MTPKEIYCMGRAKFLMDFEGYSFKNGYKKAEQEWEETHGGFNNDQNRN